MEFFLCSVFLMFQVIVDITNTQAVTILHSRLYINMTATINPNSVGQTLGQHTVVLYVDANFSFCLNLYRRRKYSFKFLINRKILEFRQTFTMANNMASSGLWQSVILTIDGSIYVGQYHQAIGRIFPTPH